jgi:hypothetical protein
MRNLADIAGDYIPVTGSSGERVYCSLEAGGSGRQPRRDARSARRRGGGGAAGLLETPIGELMRQVFAFVFLLMPLACKHAFLALCLWFVDLQGGMRQLEGNCSNSIDGLLWGLQVERAAYERVLQESRLRVAGPSGSGEAAGQPAAMRSAEVSQSAPLRLPHQFFGSISSYLQADDSAMSTAWPLPACKSVPCQAVPCVCAAHALPQHSLKPAACSDTVLVLSSASQQWPAAAQGAAAGEALWVDKYAPRSFLDLLGDEGINREVLRWLSAWHACVFGRGAAPGNSSSSSMRGGRQPQLLGAAPQGRPGGGGASAAAAALDSRPEQKILLLCGAPGARMHACMHAHPLHGCASPLPSSQLYRGAAEG